MMLDTSKSILQKVRLPIEKDEPFSFDLKRDDLIDPVISGNKWRKLKYAILKAKSRKNDTLITYGGPFSNHLVATSKAAKISGFKSVGIVRGDELNVNSNPSLRQCAAYGMKLIFVSRSDYRNKDSREYRAELLNRFVNSFIIPEGGKDFYGVVGCQEILTETTNDYDSIYLAGGTGTTAAGVILSAASKTKVNLVSALKGSFLKDDVSRLLMSVLQNEEAVNSEMEKLKMHNDSHFGGYAKVSEDLIDLINSVYDQTSLKLDPIYTGKAFYQMLKDRKSGKIKPNDKVLFIHTGGLQGAKSWSDQLNYFPD